jgi:hypothetical protein
MKIRQIQKETYYKSHLYANPKNNKNGHINRNKVDWKLLETEKDSK